MHTFLSFPNRWLTDHFFSKHFVFIFQMSECDHEVRQIWPETATDGGSVWRSERLPGSSIIRITPWGHKDTLGEGVCLKKPLIFIGWSTVILLVWWGWHSLLPPPLCLMSMTSLSGSWYDYLIWKQTPDTNLWPTCQVMVYCILRFQTLNLHFFFCYQEFSETYLKINKKINNAPKLPFHSAVSSRRPWLRINTHYYMQRL